MFKSYFTFISLCAFCMCGCQHNPSFKDALLKDDAKNYSVFAPVSIEYLQYDANIEQGNWGVIQGVEHRKNSPAELEKYLQHLRKLAARLKDQSDWNDLEQKAKGGQVYFYKWEKYNTENYDRKLEIGFLIVSDGKIVCRDILEESQTKTESKIKIK